MNQETAPKADADRDALCMDCGVDTREIEHYYMLRDDIWKAINPKRAGMLCLFCVERRLGRGLVRTDFAAVLLNTWQEKKCPELAVRLHRDLAPDHLIISAASKTKV